MTRKMSAAAGKYAGLDRFEARKANRRGPRSCRPARESHRSHAMPSGRGDRCGTIIEARAASTQWFREDEAAGRAGHLPPSSGGRRRAHAGKSPHRIFRVDAQHSRLVAFSRQLWWGHRIPAWHCSNCKEIIVARQAPEKMHKMAARASLTQDPDVLETWFQFGAVAVLDDGVGLPDTPDYRKYYPTSLLVTRVRHSFFSGSRA